MELNPRKAPYLVFMLTLSVFAILAMAVGALAPLSPESRTVLEYADIALCAAFFCDFVITLARSEHRIQYFVRWGWLDLLSSIPAIDALRWARAGRIVRIVRVLRAIKAARIVSVFLLERRAQSTALVAGAASLLLVVFASAAVLQFESSSSANIKTAEDALWWATVTVTTVGYGDRFPISTEGRVIGVLLMAAGIALLGTLSGLAAAWFVGPNREEVSPTELQRLSEEVRLLREQLNRKAAHS